MKIIKPFVEFITPKNGKAVMERLERCGRVCYKSEGNIEEGSSEKFLRALVQNGHESVLEHCSKTVKITCDRGVSHELVRHRLASYSQESSRYCNYSKDKFGSEITVIHPCYLSEGTTEYKVWKSTCEITEECYFLLLYIGRTPEEARAILPNSLKTEIMVTANIREWRTILKQRTSPAAHPQMREIMMMILEEFYDEMPVLFEDIMGGVKNVSTD